MAGGMIGGVTAPACGRGDASISINIALVDRVYSW